MSTVMITIATTTTVSKKKGNERHLVVLAGFRRTLYSKQLTYPVICIRKIFLILTMAWMEDYICRNS